MQTALNRIKSTPWIAALIGAVLLWTAFPPLGLFWVAPFAIVPWLWIIAREEPLCRRDYLHIWLASCLLWLALLQGVRLAYWPLYAGWFALSIYVAVYLPLFIVISRIGVHRYRMPIALVAPIAWVGMELIRGYFATGFSTCLLAHTQVKVPIVLQIASQLGCYGVSTWVMLIGCLLFHAKQLWTDKPGRSAWISIGVCSVFIFTSLGYGWFELQSSDLQKAKSDPLLRVALIQENSPTRFEADPKRNERSWFAYLNETERFSKKNGLVDIVVWPESVFNLNDAWMQVDSSDHVPPDLEALDWTPAFMQELSTNWGFTYEYKVDRVLAAAKGDSMAPRSKLESEQGKTHLLLGCDRFHVTEQSAERFNIALWIGPDAKVIDHYAKQHLVMFGEYIPGGDWFPMLYRPFGSSAILSGKKTLAIECKETVIAPSICFENTLPHLVRRQVLDVASQKRYPDILINITNDGWFRGSSILDHHLASAILAAVENRRPMLIAANTGMSAWIDGDGRLLAISKRLSADSILAEPTRDTRSGLWRSIGDLPAKLCALVSILIGIGGFLGSRKKSL